MKVLLIDNYDSFTHNLKQVLEQCNASVEVVRNDAIVLEELDKYDGLVLSPGPGIPATAGDLKKVIEVAYAKLPILGICLGMQAIGEVFNASLRLLSEPLHGIATEVEHFGHAFFQGISSRFTVGRYHSWVVDETTINSNLEIISRDDENRVMGIKVKDYPVFGLQFHPESIMTEDGEQMITNFLTQIKKNANLIK